MADDDRKIDHLQSALNELRTVNRIIDRICRIRETNHIMSVIIDELIAITGATQGVINLLSPAKDESLETIARKKQPGDEIPFKVSRLVMGWVIKNNMMLKVDDLDDDNRIGALSSEGGQFKSILCYPMVVRGEIIGLTSLVRNDKAGPFNEDQARVAGIIVSQSAQMLGNAKILEELARKNELLEMSTKKLHDENVRLQSEISRTFSFENIVGKSEAIRSSLTLASKFSGNDAPVLITGPTGSGKELVARAIHFNSDRKGKPFVIKNCGVKTESLLESELFGHVKGAFTGADRDKPGLFREADGGTVFLDEIGDAPPATQMAILRVIETGEIRPVGATGPSYVNVRVISATNRNLLAEIEKGTFRQDLYYRLNTFSIDMPPLSRRRDDIPLLVHYFLKKLKIKLGNEELAITPAALEMLTNYPWPGNVRQLENEIERAAVISNADGLIDINDFSPEIIGAAAGDVRVEQYHGRLREITEKVEQDIIRATLRENKGNILRTSKALGLTRKGLKEKMARYNIEAEPE